VKFIIVNDFLSSEVLGGAEINNKILCEELLKRNHQCMEKKSSLITEDFIKQNEETYFIISNFCFIKHDLVDKIKKLKYVIYEHDHKYLATRNPALYQNFTAPKDQIIFRDFYKKAKAVFCQSKFHSLIVKNNLNIDNIINLSGNLWSNADFDFMENMLTVQKKNVFSILDSKTPHKNTFGAIKYCRNKDYELVSSTDQHQFLKSIGSNSKFCFLPKTPETLSRVVVEARMMGCEVHVNNLVGATSEPWFSLKGLDLINAMREKKEQIVNKIIDSFENEKTCKIYNISYQKKPKVSLVTSMFKGDKYIEKYLKNLTNQSIFDQCELIIVNADSPGNEDAIINKYMQQYDNIIYKKLDHDPGIYGCWNIGIEMAKGEYISNANLDDIRSLQQVEILAEELDRNLDVDLVYSECYITRKQNEEYENNSSNGMVYPIKDYRPENMIKCLPGCMPMWRKSMHDKAGYFDASYSSAGDWEMWLRAIKNGSKFKKVYGSHGLYYINPDGLSTSAENKAKKHAEEKEVFWKYVGLYKQSKEFEWHKEYFK
jgi:GT2 family glycosyltransferase